MEIRVFTESGQLEIQNITQEELTILQRIAKEKGKEKGCRKPVGFYICNRIKNHSGGCVAYGTRNRPLGVFHDWRETVLKNSKALLFKPVSFYVKVQGIKLWKVEFYSTDGLSTVCILTHRYTKKTRAGVSTFNLKDSGKYEFDLSTGRKHALIHALENSDIPVEYRSLFFDEFFKTHERRDIWNRKTKS